MNIILDANLLLLYVVGTVSRDYIEKHKRLNSYTDEDFDLLVNTLSSATSVLVTPNILTETSNLARYIADPARTHIYQFFAELIKDSQVDERLIESKAATARTEFVRLGLTDSVILALATEGHTLLTADLALYVAAVCNGLKAENFNHLRNL